MLVNSDKYHRLRLP